MSVMKTFNNNDSLARVQYCLIRQTFLNHLRPFQTVKPVTPLY